MKQMGKFRGSEKDYYYLNSTVTSQQKDAPFSPISPWEWDTSRIYFECSLRAGVLSSQGRMKEPVACVFWDHLPSISPSPLVFRCFGLWPPSAVLCLLSGTDREGKGFGEFQGLMARSNCFPRVNVSKFKVKGTEMVKLNEVASVHWIFTSNNLKDQITGKERGRVSTMAQQV